MRGLRRWQGIKKAKRLAYIERMRWSNNHWRGQPRPHYYRNYGDWFRRAIYTRVQYKSTDAKWWHECAAYRRERKSLDEFESQLEDMEGPPRKKHGRLTKNISSLG